MSEQELFTYEQRDVIRFCAIECKMQVSGEESVHWMLDGWSWVTRVQEVFPKPQSSLIEYLGQLIEPVKNKSGFRKCGVRVGSDIKMDWERVPESLTLLVDQIAELTPAEFFKEYENIHPFVDGNGRTGQILFNWLNNTLYKPVWAPNFWNDQRRHEGYGA